MKLLRRIFYILGMLIVTSLFGNFSHASTLMYAPASYLINSNGTIFTDATLACQNRYAYDPNITGVTGTQTATQWSCNIHADGTTYDYTYNKQLTCQFGDYNGQQCQYYAPDCTAPQTYNSATNTCTVPAPTCTSGQTQSIGYYELGTSPTTDFPATQCKSGCLSHFEGTVPSNRYMKNGKWQYTALGKFVTDGLTCSPDSSGAGAVSVPTSFVPTSSCGGGQVGGTVNGVYTCINQSTGTVANPNTEQPKATTAKNTVTNPDGSSTTTETTTNADGSQKKTTTTTNTDGSTTSQVSSIGATKDNPEVRADGKTQAAKDAEDGTKEGLKNFCTENPDSPMCKQIDSGVAVSTSGLYTKGDIYDRDSTLPSFKNSLTNFTNDVKTAPFYSSATSFFTVSTSVGSCSGLTGDYTFASSTFHIDLDTVFCSGAAQSIYQILGIGLKLAAAWVGFFIAFIA